jgi:hypothetical protein
MRGKSFLVFIGLEVKTYLNDNYSIQTNIMLETALQGYRCSPHPGIYKSGEAPAFKNSAVRGGLGFRFGTAGRFGHFGRRVADRYRRVAGATGPNFAQKQGLG